jgi:hypothetical protein
MLSAAFGDWTRTLTERDFDEMFLSLLRASGFYDVHFTHGAHEYGKDVIAKRSDPPTQFAFQCKAGDIDGPEWAKLFAQLFQLTRTQLVHPSFDSALECEFVLVSTGRLKGTAAQTADQFKADVARQPGKRFSFWGDSNLRDMLAGHAVSALPPGPGVLPILGRIASGSIEERELEHLTAALIPPPGSTERVFFRSILDNTIVTAALSQARLPFHALTAALNEVRIVACRAHDDPAAATLLSEAMVRYRHLGDSLLAPLLSQPEKARMWLEWCGGMPGKILTYPSVCLRTAEFLGLTALTGAPDAQKRVEILSQLVANQPGVSRPISDRYAASLAPAVVALARFGHTEHATALIKATTRWLCDRYERSEFGLAEAGASPKEEAEALLGAPSSSSTSLRDGSP